MHIKYYYDKKNNNPHHFCFSRYTMLTSEDLVVLEDIRRWLRSNAGIYNQGYNCWAMNKKNCNEQNQRGGNVYIRDEEIAMAFKLSFSEYMK